MAKRKRSWEELCHRCGRPSNPLSSRDVETGWMGWCMVCNAYWHHHNVMSSIKCCSRVCSVIWPVVCGLGLYIPVAMAIMINAYLFADQLRLDSQSLPLVVLHQSTSTSSESLQAADWYDDYSSVQHKCSLWLCVRWFQLCYFALS